MKKEGRGAARYSPYRQRLRPSAPGFIEERNYRGGISDVHPHPARLNPRARRWPLRPLWLNPALCGSPVYRRGAKSEERRMTILIRFPPLKSGSDLGPSVSGDAFGPPRKAGPTRRKQLRRLLLRLGVTERMGGLNCSVKAGRPGRPALQS